MYRSRSGTLGAPMGSSNSVSPVTLSGDSEDEYTDVNGIDDPQMVGIEQFMATYIHYSYIIVNCNNMHACMA